MANLRDNIGERDGLVAGDDFDIERTITGLADGRTVVKAWLTVKTSTADADPGLLQKAITGVEDVSQGVISDPGSGTAPDRSATVLFYLSESDTRQLVDNPEWDIQVKLDDGTVSTPFVGRIKAKADVTTTTT